MSDREAIEALGRAIAAWREARGMTQENLALQIGVTNVSISRYEAGKRKVSPGIMARISKALGVPAMAFQFAPSDPDEARRIEQMIAVLQSKRGDAVDRWLAAASDLPDKDK